MAIKKYKKTEAKEITNVMLEDMLSPFKVQNWLARNFDAKTASGKTIREIFVEHGFTRKKVMLSDLFQFDGQTCILEKVCKVSDFDTVKYWDAQFTKAGIFMPIAAVPHEYIKVGLYYYRAVRAGNNVFAFLQSLDAVNMINAEHEKQAERIKTLLDKNKEAERKRAVKAKKAFNNAAKKVRNEEVSKIISQLKAVPVCATYSPFQLAKTALTMYYAA